MKLKFRADPKDWMIFILFCIALFYMSAIAVLNLSEFSKYGTFYGLNPLPAFTPEFILPTFAIFIFALAAIIMSVSSYFFDREKGIGFSAEAKSEKGYSRWATDKEMKKELNCVDALAPSSEYAGIPILNDGKKIWVDAGEYHNLIIGSTGSGKTEMLIQPMVKILAKKGESMIITDPKGEIYEKNALELKEKGYNIVLLNFRNPQNGNCWNPFTLPYGLYKAGDSDKACELLEDLAANILYDENAKNQDPFWEKTSADYFTGLSLGLFEDAKAEEINLNSINLMTTAGEDKVGGNTTYMKEYFSYKDQASPAYINVASTIMAPNETKSSILSVFKQKIKLFSSRENLSEMLSHSDFAMEDIGRKKTAVFIVIQDEKKTYHSLVTIFLKQCYETLIRVAQENGGKLPYKTNFILDEFANMPPLKDVTTMVTAARSRAIRFTFVIQNFAQLYEVYGKENGETIKGNCGNILYLISSELQALEEISKMCGEVKSKDKDKTDSRPLVTVSDLQRLPKWTLIALRIRMMPFKTKLTPNWQMVKDNSWGKNYGLASYPVREKIPVNVFDIKKFVDAKKEAKFASMFNNITGGNSSNNASSSNNGGGMPFNPFQPSNNKPGNGGFDVDEMVRRIDAKIAELEAEEQAEKEAQKKEKEAKKETETKPVIPVATPVEPVKAAKEPVIEDIKIDNVAKPVDIVLPTAEPIPTVEPVIETPVVEATPVVEPIVEKVATIEPVKAEDSNNNSTFFDFIVPVKEEPLPPKKEKKKEEVVEEKEEIIEEPQLFDQIVETEPVKIIEEPILEEVKIPEVNKPKQPEIKVKEEVIVPQKVEIEEKEEDEDNIIIDNNYVTDDQFFDDFFADE